MSPPTAAGHLFDGVTADLPEELVTVLAPAADQDTVWLAAFFPPA